LGVLSQLIQRFLVHTTVNKDHFKTNPPPHECNKLIPNTTPRTGMAEPGQIPRYDAILRDLGSASHLTLDDVEFLEVREDGVGGRHHDVKKSR